MSMTRLARLAKVSVSTVSKAFSGSKEVSEKKREEIFSIAKKYGYYDKYIGKYHKGPLIGVICPEFKSRYYSDHLENMEKEVKKRGGTLVASSTEFDNDRKNELLDFYANRLKVDGIIVYSYDNAKILNIPVVVIGSNNAYTSIALSNENAIYEAIKFFSEYGHTNIAYIGETHTEGQTSSFEDALLKNGIEIKKEYEIIVNKRFEEAGYDAMNKLFECSPPPTAVLAGYDNIAVGAIKSIHEHGKKIPEDISIIGMNDNMESEYLALSSITSYNEDLCQIVVDALFSQIYDNKKTNKQVKLSTELIKRGSVGKVKK